MKQLWIILVMVVSFGIGASSAWAHSAHSNHQNGVNPFENGKGHKKAHCLLHHHRYPTQVCPHHRHNPDSPIHEMAVDCGGAPTGSLPQSTSAGSTLFLIAENNHNFDLVGWDTLSSSFPAATLYYDLSPPPPESI